MNKKFKIMMVICVLMVLSSYSNGFAAITEEKIAYEYLSPDEKMSLKVKCEGNQLSYKIAKDDEEVLQWSVLGLDTSLGDFYNGLQIDTINIEDIDESFSMFSGKRSVYTNKCKEIRLTLTNVDGNQMNVTFRVYNQGVAYNYGIEHSEPFQILDEKGVFALPDSVDRYYAMEYLHYYEGFYYEQTGNLSGNYAMPLLYKLDSGTSALIAQAKLTGDYNGRMLIGDGSTVLKVKAVHKRTADNKKALKDLDIPTVPADFVSPWRVVIIGHESTLINTEMIEALNDPENVSSTDWIKPGTSGWSWWNGDPTDNADVYKAYIDYCQAMEYPYMLLDAGWTRTVENNTFSSLKEYADSKGIGLFVWAHQNELDTPEKLNKLNDWKELGIVGIKVDFFDSEEQKRIKLYDDILKRSEELQLMVNFHGSNASSGLRRTYPHLITQEGIRGAEYTKIWYEKSTTAKHNVTVPFTRNVVGPMDYTPVTYSDADGKYTFAHSTALPVVFESGMTCIADKPWQLLVSHAFNFLKGIPSTWDETVFLEGDVGKYVSIARKKQDTWYIGSICDGGRNANLDLSFLDDATLYLAEIIEDGAGYSLKNRLEEVTSETTLTIPLRERGGVAIKIKPKEDLPESNWQVIRRDGNFVPMGFYESVKIDNTEKGDLYLGSNDLKNLALMGINKEDFTITTKVYFEPNKKYQKAGIIVYKDDDHYVSVQKAFHPTWGGNSFAMSNEDAGAYDEQGIQNPGKFTNYLKIEKQGTVFSGYWSEDGEQWILISEMENITLTSELKIGFFASNGTEKYFSSERDAVFSEFKLNEEIIPLRFD